MYAAHVWLHTHSDIRLSLPLLVTQGKVTGGVLLASWNSHADIFECNIRGTNVVMYSQGDNQVRV
jgi:hypothetical protein